MKMQTGSRKHSIWPKASLPRTLCHLYWQGHKYASASQRNMAWTIFLPLVHAIGRYVTINAVRSHINETHWWDIGNSERLGTQSDWKDMAISRWNLSARAAQQSYVFGEGEGRGGAQCLRHPWQSALHTVSEWEWVAFASGYKRDTFSTHINFHLSSFFLSLSIYSIITIWSS